MNILQILPEFRVGGVETGTLDLARHLIKKGHKAVVISAGGELVKELESFGGIHYELPVHKKSFFSILKMIPKVSQIIKKEKIDIVHARSRVPAWIAYFACRRTKRAFVTTCHGYYSKHFFSYAMSWGKRVIALSNVIARHMVDDFGVQHERIKIIPRSVDLDKFKYIPLSQRQHDEFNVGIIARITPIKGHLYFIKALALAAKSIPRLKIWIIGSAADSKAAYKEELQVLVKRLGLWHNTEFLGTQRNIPSLLSNLDLLVLATTTHEAFGRVIIEAQAAGVPVVATKVGGVVDIIEDSKTGLLVPAKDPESMSNAVVRIYKDKELAEKISQNAYAKVKEKYNVDLMVESTLDVYKDALASFNILIIKFSSAGDLILSSAAIRAIRKQFPSAYKISFLVDKESKDILLRCPYIDELIVCDLKSKDAGLSGLLRLGKNLRRKCFDIVIDLQNNRKSHIVSYLTMAPERYGYNNKKFGFLLNHSIRNDLAAMNPVEHQFRPLKMLGIDLSDSSLEVWPAEKDEAYIKELLNSEWLSDKQKLIGINISASARWRTKNLPLESIAKFCQDLNKRDMRVVITGTAKDSSAAATLLNMAKEAKIINCVGKTTINQLACLIRKCDVYISCDSAPLHVAAAVKTPFVALFGATDPGRHMPPTTGQKYVLIKKDLACSPCYKTKCKRNVCMNGISAEEIIEAVEKLL